jgi:hypothetical protein
MPSGAAPALHVIVSPDGRSADGLVDGQLLWSIACRKSTAVSALLQQITGTVTTLLRRLLYLHAGVVAVGGRAIVVVGESGTGKTSTVAALVREGAAYLSDEVAVFDPERRVALPFMLPMAVKRWTREAAGVLPAGSRIHHEAGVEYWLPERRWEREAPPVMIVLLRAGPTARLVPVSPPQMLLSLAEQASSFKQPPRIREAFCGLVGVLRGARCMALESPRPAASAGLLLERLEAVR